MPELPEIQGLAERVGGALTGARFVRADPLSFSSLKTVAPAPEELCGLSLDAAGRRGKFLVLSFSGSDSPSAGTPSADGARLLVHLSQGGRVDLVKGRTSGRPRGGVVRLVFDRDPSLLVKEYGTERKAGWWVLAPGDEGPLARLGPEPFSGAFESLVADGDDAGWIHALLRDQRRVAGIGRGYADDILHRARLSPYRSLRSLNGEERRRLLGAVRGVLAEALEVERRRRGGLPAKLGDHFAVHGRAGTPCPACGTELRRVSFASHEVVYCPACQTGGKVLADRRLSRLVR